MSQRRTVIPPAQASGQGESPFLSSSASAPILPGESRPSSEVPTATEPVQYAAGTGVHWGRLGVALLVCLAIVIGALTLV
jgi:hypothetical protein